MNLVQIYMKDQISRMARETGLHKEEMNPRESLHYLWYWRKISDDSFEEIDRLFIGE